MLQGVSHKVLSGFGVRWRMMSCPKELMTDGSISVYWAEIRVVGVGHRFDLADDLAVRGGRGIGVQLPAVAGERGVICHDIPRWVDPVSGDNAVPMLVLTPNLRVAGSVNRQRTASAGKSSPPAVLGGLYCAGCLEGTRDGGDVPVASPEIECGVQLSGPLPSIHCCFAAAERRPRRFA